MLTTRKEETNDFEEPAGSPTLEVKKVLATDKRRSTRETVSFKNELISE